MKKIITLIALTVLSFSCLKSFSQVTYPCGVYFIGMNGTSDYGLWSQAFNSADITLATWVQVTDASSIGKRMAIFSRYDYNVENENTDFSLVLNEAGEYEFSALVLGSGGQVQDNLPFGFKPTVGVWYHIAVTFNGTSHQCNEYVNGNLTASKSFAGPLSYVIVGSAFSKTISFGARYYPQNSGIVNTYFKGYFDEAVYASKELSADAIKTLAMGIAAGNSFIADNSIVIYHKFDDYPGQPNYGVSGGTLPTNGQYYYCPAQYNPPVANAGPDQTITLPENTVTLNGRATPGTGTIVSGVWSKESGPAGGDISDPNSQTPVITNLQEGTYVFKLTITDDKGYTGTDEVSIFVKAEREFDTSKCPGILIDISGIINSAYFLNVFWENLDHSSFDPTRVDAGNYLLVTTIDNLIFVTTKIIVTNYPKPNLGPDTSQVFCPITYADESHLFDDIILEHPNYTIVGWYSLAGVPIDPTLVSFDIVHLIVKNEFGCFDTASVFPIAYPVLNILPAEPQERIANRETPDGFNPDWTNYYYDFNDNTGKTYLLLSIKTADYPNIGHVGDGTFEVKEVATSQAGSGTAIKLNNPNITNPGVYAMNRYWNVKVDPSKEPVPGQEVGVRFYYNNQDFNDLKSSIPGLTDANSMEDNNKLYFYVVHGANPDPNSNFDGANPDRLTNGEIPATDTWVDSLLGCGEHRAEFTVTTFSGGGGGATVNGLPLPVTLRNFAGVFQNKNVLLKWQISQQINTSFFIIERSVNGTDFSSIGKVSASGNSSTIKNYSYIDSKPLNGINYYRLKMVDADGKFTYSKVVAVKNDNNESSFRIFPNPANETLHVQASGSNNFTTLQIFDAGGRKLKEEKVMLNGNTSTSIDIKDLPNGVYNLLLKSKTVNEHQKFVKQ